MFPPVAYYPEEDITASLVFFDLETSGLHPNADVLQIAMKFQGWDERFNAYITPTRPISPEASQINKLTIRNGELYHKDTKKTTQTQKVVLSDMLEYLNLSESPSILVAHNCPFDAFYLMRIIKEEGLVDQFRELIIGFTDTYRLLRNKFPLRRSKGQLTLSTLANELSLSSTDAHNAMRDVDLLEKIARHHFSDTFLVENRKCFNDVLKTPRYY